jgi:hypothetical protein
MPVIESTQNRLVLKSGSNTLTLDKQNGRAIFQRKVVIWRLKPSEASVSQISDVSTDRSVDRASGVEIWHTTLVLSTGEGWAFPAADKQEAEANVTAIRQFLSLS